MRAPRIQSTSLLVSAALVAATFVAPACSSDRDTILALTINSNQEDVGGPAQLRITVTPQTGQPVVDTLMPTVLDGSIQMSIVHRLTLNGLSGTVTVLVEALDGSGTAYLSATTTADLIDKGAVAARIELKVMEPDPDAGTPPPPDGGVADADDDAGG
jgi:hypothetical protein